MPIRMNIFFCHGELVQLSGSQSTGAGINKSNMAISTDTKLYSKTIFNQKAPLKESLYI